MHTIILGSGAAGLNAALQLRRRGIEDLLLITESLQGGTSINTGSDKQTYYKLGLYGQGEDSPRTMCETLFNGGATDGDTALIEAALSLRGFYNLLELGVPFPQDAFGQFPGYKTDHDPRQRATSIGPYTSQRMCRVLIEETRRLGIPVAENRVAVKLLTVTENERPRIAGLVCVNVAAPLESAIEVHLCENLVFALGGPGGLYRDSVYPLVHTGGIGLALEIGAEAQNLAEGQFGLASTAFRWNVSGSYMQAIPRFVSTQRDGKSDPREFLCEEFPDPNAMFEAIFLKGYQWPFDVTKIEGSSLVDLLVHRETVQRGRRVFLDYRTNSEPLDFTTLPDEPRTYLENCRACFGTPLERLETMNPGAIALYRNNGIDLAAEPLEIALCVQHNNGGLAVNRWWESTNVAHLFVAGEVAGTHGVSRPGGSALNAGQVASFRIAEFIAAKYRNASLHGRDSSTDGHIREQAESVTQKLSAAALEDWKSERDTIQARMSDHLGPILIAEELDAVFADATEYVKSLRLHKCVPDTSLQLAESLRTRILALTHLLYIAAVRDTLLATGSRGSRLLLEENAPLTHPKLHWSYRPENVSQREYIHVTRLSPSSSPEETTEIEIQHTVRPRRPIPHCDAWFETAWAEYREGKIFE